MECDVCLEPVTSLLSSSYPGYNSEGLFQIRRCERCQSNLAYPRQVSTEIYDRVYSSHAPAGSYYGALYGQATQIKAASDPLRFLSNSVHGFFAVESCIEGQQGLNVLEIGCGYGYLTWALRQRGHHACGIDVSVNAIRFAKDQFGPHYETATIEEFANSHHSARFDLIVAVEVIEHVPHPREFIRTCASMLGSMGRLVLTTPNKGFYPQDVVWTSDPPPIHMTLLSAESFACVAHRNGMELSYVNFSRHLAVDEKLNKPVTWLLSRKRNGVIGGDSNEGVNASTKNRDRPFLKRVLYAILIDSKMCRNVLNWLYQFLFRAVDYDSTLGVVMWNSRI